MPERSDSFAQVAGVCTMALMGTIAGVGLEQGGFEIKDTRVAPETVQAQNHFPIPTLDELKAKLAKVGIHFTE